MILYLSEPIDDQNVGFRRIKVNHFTKLFGAVAAFGSAKVNGRLAEVAAKNSQKYLPDFLTNREGRDSGCSKRTYKRVGGFGPISITRKEDVLNVAFRSSYH
jgi:hypothetical protein